MATTYPVIDEDKDELLGYVVHDAVGWQAQTVFNYPMARTMNEAAAVALVREEGLAFLKGVWQYYDSDDYDWYTCVIKDILGDKVTVSRTNALGYIEPEHHKIFVVKQPDEEHLIKM